MKNLCLPASAVGEMWARAKVMLGLLLTAFSLIGCAARSSSGSGSRLNTVERMMWSTYPLASQKGMGTSFVVAMRDGTSANGVTPIVFTSTHVLATVGRGPLMIGARVADERGEPEVVVLQFQPKRGLRRFYVQHPRQDMAAFALRLPDDLAGLVDVHSFLDERSIVSRPGSLRAGSEVSFLGFPEVLPGTSGAFPILRTGRVASYPLDTAAADGLFVINADVYPGDSGGPVFITGRGGRPELVGMIIRRIGSDERTFSHLAIAVDAAAIRETLQLVSERENQVVATRVAAQPEKPARAR